MALETYKQKRNFKKSPEPTGGNPVDNTLHFVIQKHHASHLHYDFRLELRGILKSWAVPKGPSMETGENRLAMLVEDHPWDYRDFEGIIPSGYGKGTVIVWDEGTYETRAINEKDKKAQEHSITSQFWKGQIKLVLHGHKVKGEFQITRAKDKGENAWYLVKVNDKYSSKKDITLKEKSVLSQKTLEEVALDPAARWESHKPAKNEKSAVDVAEERIDVSELLKAGVKQPMPKNIEPMLCTLIREPFNKPDWLYEVKWDGYRIIALVEKGKPRLDSRGGQNYTKKYLPVIEEFKLLKYEAVIDGEVVVLDENGKPDFSALQNYKGDKPIAFYCFDLLWCNEYNLTKLPLTERKELLNNILPESEIIKISESFDDGIELFNSIKKMGIEGVVAKKKDSIYNPGKKGNTWYKIKVSERQEYIIGGWTESTSPRLFRSLIFGHYVDGKLTYVHHSGGGFNDEQMKDLLQKLKKIEIKKSPFVNKVESKTTPHWAKPVLVAEFEKSTKTTTSGKIRHPAIFVGLREDKKPQDVVEEVPANVETQISKELSPAKEIEESKSITDNTPGSWELLNKRVITSENDFTIEEHKLKLINIERELWPGITKADVIKYYISVADYILPHLKDRPLGLNIELHSAVGGGNFLRGMEGNQPGWATIFTTERKHKKKGKSDHIEWLVCNDIQTLVYAVNLESIDIHPWTSRMQSPNNPDYIAIDLDPSDDDFLKAVETANAAKEFFGKHKLRSFIKTSGKTGLHLFLPCDNIEFGDSRKIAENICKEVHSLVPDITTTNVSVNSRGKKLYIDPNQNDYADRVAATYCVRAYHTPSVSTPLEWKEVTNKLHPSDFTIKTIGARIKKKGDLFKNILDNRIRIGNSKILKQFL